jgi:hypothetical protein
MPILLSPLLALAFAVYASAASAGPTLPKTPALALSFVALDGGTRTMADGRAWMDAGHLRATGRQPRVVVRERVGLRLEGQQGFARVSVSLASEVPGGTVRVNGRPVSAFAQVIDPAQRVGTTVVHDIELVIPADAPAGGFLGNLQWLAETP